jgi:hypothetical protein
MEEEQGHSRSVRRIRKETLPTRDHKEQLNEIKHVRTIYVSSVRWKGTKKGGAGRDDIAKCALVALRRMEIPGGISRLARIIRVGNFCPHKTSKNSNRKVSKLT